MCYNLFTMNTESNQTQENNPGRGSTLSILDRYYPGICQVILDEQQFPTDKLAQLVTLIHYSLPWYLMNQSMKLFESQLMEVYLTSLVGLEETERKSNDIPVSNNTQIDEISQEHEKKSQESQDDDSEKTLSDTETKKTDEAIELDKSDIIKYSPSQISTFIQQLNLAHAKQSISNQLVNSVEKLRNCRRQQKIVQVVKIQFKKPSQTNKEKRKPKYSKEEKKTQIISVILGDKIPLETKLMRKQIMKMAENSFAVTSETNEKSLSEIAQKKVEIVLILNKIAEQNIHEFEEKIKIFIREEELSCFFIEKVEEKCIIEPQTIPLLCNLMNSLMKMKIKEFDSSFQQPNKKKLNPFHLMLIKKLQLRYYGAISSPSLVDQRRKYLIICKFIGKLIKVKVLSKRVLNAIVDEFGRNLKSAITLNSGELIEVLIEGVIVLIQALGQKYDSILEKASENKKQNLSGFVQEFSKNETIIPLHSLIDFITQADKQYISHTERIKCLIENMKTRRKNMTSQTNSVIENKPQVQYQVLKKELAVIFSSKTSSEEKQKKIINLIGKTSQTEVMIELLKKIYDGSKDSIEASITLMKNVFPATEQNMKLFSQVFEKLYFELVMDECQFPFLAATISILLRFYVQEPEAFLLKQPKQEEQYEQYQYFEKKVQKKLQHYTEVDNTELIR